MDDFMDIDDASLQQAIVDGLSAFRTSSDAFPVSPSSLPAGLNASQPVIGIPLVVDTNFMLSHVRTFGRLVQVAPALYCTIAVPYVVIHELDGLSKGSRFRDRDALKDLDLPKRAREATKVFHEALSARTPGLVGQSLADHALIKLPANATNDDRILAYCLQLASVAGGAVLLTGDTNLSVKAMVSGIQILKNSDWAIGLPETVLERFLAQMTGRTIPEPMEMINGHQQLQLPGGNGHLSRPNPHALAHDKGWADGPLHLHFEPDKDDDVEMDVDPSPPASPIQPSLAPPSPTKAPTSAALIVHAALPSLLTPPFMKHIERILSADPEIIPRPKDVWTTTDLLSMISRNWISVFSDVYPRAVRDLAPTLLKTSKELDRISKYGLGNLNGVEERNWLKGVEVLIAIEGADQIEVERCRKVIREAALAL